MSTTSPTTTGSDRVLHLTVIERFARTGLPPLQARYRACMYLLLRAHDKRLVIDGGRSDDLPGRPRLARISPRKAS